MARKKTSMSRKRNCTKERIWLQVQLNCLTGLGRSGLGTQCQNWGQSRDEGLGRAGRGDVCVPTLKSVRRNRLECCYGAVCQGEKLVFLPDFSRRYQICPLI